MKTQTLNASQKTKKTLIGDVPIDWEITKLGKYVNEVSQRNNKANPPVLSVTNTQGFVISEELFNRKVYSKDLSNYKVIKKGQFAYNPSRVNVGSIARLREFEHGLLSPMYVVFETKDGLDGEYLDYWIQSKRFRNLVKANTQGTVRDSLNFSALANFPFALPPLPEQRKTSNILSSIDSVIEKTQSVIDQTQTFKKGLMQELFTHGIPGRHKKFKKTEIGEIPKEWEVVRIKNVGEIITGTTPSTKNQDYYNGNYLWATPGDLGEDKYVRSTSKMLSEEGKEVSRMLPKNSVLVVCIGSTIGKAGMAIEKMSTNQQINTIICMDDYDPHFIYYWMVKTSSQLKLFAGKQAVPIVNKKSFSSLPILKPPKEEQKAIGYLLDTIDSMTQKEKESVAYLNNLKSALMQVLLTGEVRVKV